MASPVAAAPGFILRLVVALHHPYEVVEEPSDVATKREALERLESTLPRALLATPPDVLRGIAARAARAQATAERWEHRVGDRPAFSPESASTAVEAKAEFEAAKRSHDRVVDACTRLMAKGNIAAVTALATAGGLVFAGSSPMGLAVAVAVVAAPLGPLTATWIAAARTSSAVRDERSARQRWCDALEAAGLPTMGALAARRVAVAGWERRHAEAAAAWEAARPVLRAWQRLAGPGVAPDDIDGVLTRIEQLRLAQLALFGALLDERVGRLAMSVLEPAGEVAEPESAPGWLADALTRFRSSTIRLWGAPES